jgi:hypothetical protein
MVGAPQAERIPHWLTDTPATPADGTGGE